ncbi:MAG: ribonuclease P protein component [Pseudohongiellaceae bacterium]|jgi:ribonuclease P protein component
MDFSFGKSLRLLDAATYKSVFDDAQIKVSKQQVLLLSRPNGLNHPRVGLVIAKKNVRLASQRNRIKRNIRETFRLQQHQLGGIDTVVLARRGLDQLNNSDLQSLFDQLWQQLERKATKKIKQSQANS